MREIDRLTTERFGVPSLTLMENAAAATARVVMERLDGRNRERSVLILCGRGNNGGDGAATARLLAGKGSEVLVVLFGKIENCEADAAKNFKRARKLANVQFFECNSEEEWRHLRSKKLERPPSLIVDALLGTGLTRPIEGLLAGVLNFVNDCGVPVVSVDIPSGLSSDSGELIGPAIHADITVTMTAPKPANVLPPAADYNGDLVIAGIGSPAELIDEAKSQLFLIEKTDAQRWLKQTRYTPASYKNQHGHVLVIAGSRGFTGAAALCGNAAMRSGAGLVTVATPVSAQPLVATQVMPEVMTASLAETDRGTVSEEAIDFILKFSERATVMAIGPGLSSEDDRTRNFVKAVVAQRRTPIAIDADGLNCLSPWPAELRGSSDLPVILTPHHGEMRRLTGAGEKSPHDPVTSARDFATAHQVIVLLKGSRSLIAAPDGRVFINPTGNAGLGTAGSGDTLTGIVAGFLAQAFGTRKQNADALEAVIAALYIGGLAGDIAADKLGMRVMVASDIREHLSAAILSLDPDGEKPS